MGAFDLALGNIFGSNSFNMLLLAPLDFVHHMERRRLILKPDALPIILLMLAAPTTVYWLR